jgi:hypothetical protein
MNRYWLGIGAGALVIFGVGMTGIKLGQKGWHELKTAAAGPVAEVLQEPIAALRFSLDGERIGRVRSIEVQSDGRWTDNAIRLVVGLDDPSVADRLSRCAITADRFHGPKDDARFRCLSEAELEHDRMVQIGEVRFEPADMERPLYVSERDRRRLERSDVRSLTANLTSADGESVKGRATFDIKTRHGRHERGVVTIRAGDGTALIDIRDEKGNRVFELNASESGVSLHAADGKGRDLIRLLAGK